MTAEQEKLLRGIDAKLTALTTTVTGNGGQGHEQRLEAIENQYVADNICDERMSRLESTIESSVDSIKETIQNNFKQRRRTTDIIQGLAPWIALLIGGLTWLIIRGVTP